MSLIKEIHTPEGAQILIWQDAEELSFFLNQIKLSAAELALLNTYNNNRRKKDLVIARYLLQSTIPQAEVAYYPSGKPFLKGNKAEISISHSKDLVSVMVHKTRKVGIDIEYISPRVERVKKRFLSERELKLASTTVQLTRYWSAKETLFKLDEKQGLEFNTDISLFPKNGSLLTGRVRNSNTINIHTYTFENWVLTYAIL